MRKFRLFSIILAVLLILNLTACGNKTDDAYIYFELPEIPSTLDAQTASSDSELLIVRNIYEGLMRKNSDGEIVTGAAESFKKSGLTYTFTLRDNIFWNNDEPLTANDFVYGLRRALNPETKAPFASRLFCIKNAKEINSGSLSPDKLGVTATDNDTVKIELQFDDKSFLENLATSVAMPCNQEFFESCSGKYGLFSDKIICNGSYRLTKWNKESFGIRLYKNEEYSGAFKAKNAAVFLSSNKDIPVNEKLENNDIDIAFIDSALTADMESKGFNTENIQNICWVMTLNNSLSKDMRISLLKLIGDEVYSQSLKSGYVTATSLFPAVSGLKVASDGIVSYDLSGGKSLFKNEIKKLEDSKFPADITLKYFDNGYIKPVITDIVAHWQSNLSAFVNIESVDENKLLLPQLKEQTLVLSVFPVEITGKNIAEYLQHYNKPYDKDATEIQKDILSSNNIYPLLFQNTTLCYSQSIKEFSACEDNGYIDFAFVIKDDR